MNSHSGAIRETVSILENTKKLLVAFISRLKANPNRSGFVRRRVIRALALTPRGAIPNDVLAIKRLSVQLYVEWFARDVHPWDRDMPESRQAELFAQQCLEDIDVAIPRLFERLPEVSVIHLSVVKHGSDTQLISGVVHRETMATAPNLALGMKLKAIGVNYRLSNLRLEPISISGTS